MFLTVFFGIVGIWGAIISTASFILYIKDRKKQ